MASESQIQKILETALLAGQIMCESNAESYRVEDTMNYILTTSDADYVVAISNATSIYAILDDPSYKTGSFVGMKRITKRGNNMNNISRVNSVSRELVAGDIDIDQAYDRLVAIKRSGSEYSSWQRVLALIGMPLAFSILYGGGFREFICAGMDGLMLVFITGWTERYYVNDSVSLLIQSLFVTLLPYIVEGFWLPGVDVNTVIVSTLMALVPGTAITNAFRDIFHQDFVAGLARAAEAFFQALMIALGSFVGLCIYKGIFL